MKLLLAFTWVSIVAAVVASAQEPVGPVNELPLGRNVTEEEATQLPLDAPKREVLYLVGTFVVTASGTERAILRSFARGPGGIRIIVSYLPPIAAPPENTIVTCDGAPGFLITDLRLARDGQVNVFVRETTDARPASIP